MASEPYVLAEKHNASSPAVSLRREGDRITEIHIRCACGAEMILDCDYEQPQSQHRAGG